MRIVFMGTPEFAVPTLERVVLAGHKVALVLTQPDRPKGRGGRLSPSPVKEAALRLGLGLYQPERVRRPEVVELLRALASNAMVVVGYGQIIPQSIIDLPPYGIINVHASLLPRYRGAAPVQWAVANGDKVTGVTAMRIDAGLDTGDVLLRYETAIGPEEDALELGARLAVAGAELLVETLDALEAGTLRPAPQNDAEATLAPILKKDDGLVDWNAPATAIANRARGFLPWPGAWTWFRGQVFHIWKARPAGAGVGACGALTVERRRLLAQCGVGTRLELLEVQQEGRKRMGAEAFLNGVHVGDNEILGVKAS
ncbi:MAG: methionyl-tRNA formyltransferase [Bryobacteraceae bacterium]|jgi:methionyl-tRNA formyltransferase